MMMSRSRRAVRAAVVLAVSAVLVVACGEARPDAETWARDWNAVRGIVPPLEELGENPSESMCEEVLASLRESLASLFPTPGEALHPTVTSWVETAENIFFECPPTGGFEQGYAELLAIGEEVDAVLDIAGEG